MIRLVPSLLPQFFDLTSKAGKRPFDSMPVRMPSAFDDVLTVAFTRFPAGW
jgi:hypothetical protein